jgi:RecJ-like exonuclease
MKRFIYLFLFFLLNTAFFWTDVAGKYGDSITVKEKTPIGDITKEPEKYLDKVVRVEGELFDVCQEMGCWFSIKDSTGAIYVDLSMGIKFTMPKKSNGRSAIVQGMVTNQKGKSTLMLKGSGVEILKK